MLLKNTRKIKGGPPLKRAPDLAGEYVQSLELIPNILLRKNDKNDGDLQITIFILPPSAAMCLQLQYMLPPLEGDSQLFRFNNNNSAFMADDFGALWEWFIAHGIRFPAQKDAVIQGVSAACYRYYSPV